MKIGLVVPGGLDRSGRERVVPVLLWLIERLARRHSVWGVTLHQYPQPCRYSLLGAEIYNLGAAPGRLPGLATAVRLRRLVAAWRAVDWRPDVLHALWGGENALLAGLAGRLLGVPVVVSLAGGELAALPEIGYGAQLRWRGRLVVAAALRLAQRVTVASEYMRRLALAHGFTPQVLPLGVPQDLFAAARPAAGRPPWRLLHLASLNRVKDQATLLCALRRVVSQEPNVQLDIAGEDTLGGEIQSLNRQLGLEKVVRFHGFLPAEQVTPLFRQADLFLLPSRHEAAPVVMLEAAACGLATVGTAVGYAADWAPERALAVPVGDAEALAQAIVSLLRDGPRRQAIGLAAQSWARAHDADWTAERFEQLYAGMIGKAEMAA